MLQQPTKNTSVDERLKYVKHEIFTFVVKVSKILFAYDNRNTKVNLKQSLCLEMVNTSKKYIQCLQIVGFLSKLILFVYDLKNNKSKQKTKQKQTSCTRNISNIWNKMIGYFICKFHDIIFSLYVNMVCYPWCKTVKDSKC